jgi:hypothetical protein
MDLEDIETARDRLRFRGAQGTTGSQATFLELFKGDASKITQLNEVDSDGVVEVWSKWADNAIDPLQEGRLPFVLPHFYPDLHSQG